MKIEMQRRSYDSFRQATLLGLLGYRRKEELTVLLEETKGQRDKGTKQ